MLLWDADLKKCGSFQWPPKQLTCQIIRRHQDHQRSWHHLQVMLTAPPDCCFFLLKNNSLTLECFRFYKSETSEDRTSSTFIDGAHQRRPRSCQHLRPTQVNENITERSKSERHWKVTVTDVQWWCLVLNQTETSVICLYICLSFQRPGSSATGHDYMTFTSKQLKTLFLWLFSGLFNHLKVKQVTLDCRLYQTVQITFAYICF